MNDFVIKLRLAVRFYLIGLMYRTSRMSWVCLASPAEVAHDRLYRVLYLAFAYSRRMREWFAAHLVKDGYLLIDAAIRQRYGKKLAGVSFVWDSTIGKKVFGTTIVLLIRTDGKRRVRLGLRIWQKSGKSKLKPVEEMLREARRRGLNRKYVLFDAWYSGESLLNLSDKFGWRYCTRVKKNRLFEAVRID